MFGVRQQYVRSAPVDLRAEIESQLRPYLSRVKPGARVGVATGSRGITNIRSIVRETISRLKAAGAAPFVIPAMGSHGGATAEGQIGVLAEYGITEEGVGAPIEASMETQQLGVTEEGVELHFSAEALKADHIIIINRIKPHTDFSGSIGSGIMKMLVVGLGKRTGAANYHVSASRFGYEQVLRILARGLLGKVPLLCGLAVVENQFHETARVAVMDPTTLEATEEKLFLEAKALMPRLPFEEIDLLIIDRIGKNISGAGMDPNIIGRGVHGYSTFLGQKEGSPVVRRIFVRDLTPETHGNAIGIGFADFTTGRLVRSIDRQVTSINALTSLTPQGAKIPIYYESDREAITQALQSLALNDTSGARVIRIRDTLTLDCLEVSEAYSSEVEQRSDLEAEEGMNEMVFDADGNLTRRRV